jgi:site-specific recombinase XerD
MATIPAASAQPPRLSEMAPQFLTYGQIEQQFSPQTVSKYRECLRQVAVMIGDLPVTEYRREHVTSLKGSMLAKSHSTGRQVCILAALKGLLGFCRGVQRLPVLDPDSISFPKRPWRPVVYLTPAEVATFVTAIEITNRDGSPSEAGVRFRALVESLLGSAMRISELLSLDRTGIDFHTREARVIGKGNKVRTVFFTDRALAWLKQYLGIRRDSHAALFVTQGGRSRLGRDDIWRPFSRYRKSVQIHKRITPHLLRHTAATQLLFNGCPISHIKDILGHERLDTTCRYYLGLDLRAAKRAHQKYLLYEPEALDAEAA